MTKTKRFPAASWIYLEQNSFAKIFARLPGMVHNVNDQKLNAADSVMLL